MKHGLSNASLIFSITVSLFIGLQQALATNTVHLATAENEPYIGRHLLNQGYVYELVHEAYKRVGYNVKIKFYPLARAKQLAENGKVDGFLPTYKDTAQSSVFGYSAPFPGDNIGLLKQKKLQVEYSIKGQQTPKKLLEGLSDHLFGAVRGQTNFKWLAPLKIDFVGNDLQNIDKLAIGRIDFAFIDKYTAADLLVNQRPHLIGKLEFLHPPLISNQFHIAFFKQSPAFQQQINAFNQGLQLLKKDGSLQKILAKHGLLVVQPRDKTKTSLTIGTVNNNDMMIMKALSEQFEAIYPDIKLNWRVLDENILRQRLLGDLAISDGQFDVMTIGTYETPIWAKNKWLTPLRNFPDEYELMDVIANVRKALSYQDTLYALPFYAESSMTFYRKDLLSKAGFTMPKQPTYEKIKTIAAAIHNPSKQMYGICLRGKPGWGENIALFSTMVNTFGGRWFDEKWQPTINSSSWREAVSFYKRLMTQYGPPNGSQNGFKESLSLFANGHCGIWIDATVAAGLLFNPQYSKVHSKLGLANAPIAKTTKGAHWLWAWALAIPESSRKKAAAFKFITWATSKNYIQQVAKQEGWILVPPGTRLSTYQNKQYQIAAPFSTFVFNAIQSANPDNATLQPSPYTGIQYVSIPEFPSIGHQVSLRLVELLNDRISVDQFIRDSQTLVTQQMKDSGYLQ